MHRFVVLAALLALAACADSEPPDPTPTEDGGAYNMIDPVDLAMADEDAPAIGEWTRSMQDGRPALLFGPTGAEPLFSLSCDDREGVLLSRHGVIETGSASMMTLTTGTATHELAANPVETPLPMLRAAVPANDPLLARLQSYQGPLQVTVGDGPALVLPPSPSLGEFLRDCAAGELPPSDAPDEADDAAPPAADLPANGSVETSRS